MLGFTELDVFLRYDIDISTSVLPCRADKKQTAQRLKKQVTSLRHQISGMGTAGVTEVCDVCVSHHGKMNHSPTSFIISYDPKQHCVDFFGKRLLIAKRFPKY